MDEEFTRERFKKFLAPRGQEKDPQLKGKRMTKLYVGHLTSEMTNEELQQLFSKKGFLVTSARLICDREGGRSRGFGFVEFASQEDAQRAIEELNGMDIQGRALVVKEARSQDGRDGRGTGGGRETRSDRAASLTGAK
jgi:RNA recognition motif-containing protein